jgi:hypothetical protein
MVEGPSRLSALAIAIVVAGIALVVSIAFIAGGDVATVLYVAPIVLLGTVVVSVALKTRGGAVRPAECWNCGGLVSPNAPSCKHCGASFG